MLVLLTYFLMAFFLYGKLEDAFYKAFRRELLIIGAYVTMWKLFKRHIAFKLSQTKILLKRSLSTVEKSVDLGRDMLSDLVMRDHGG